MDQIALIGPNDGKSLKFHIESTCKYNATVERTFYIYAETPEVKEIIQAHKHPNVIYIPESSLLSPEVCRNKWIYQQLLKLSVDQLRNSHNLSELFLFTDVDTIAIRPINDDLFFRDGLPIYFMRSRHKSPILCKEYQPVTEETQEPKQFLEWHYAMTWSTTKLLGLSNLSELAAIDACVIWSQKTLRRLKRHIEKINHLPWHHAIINKWHLFLCQHQQHFLQESGFRDIAFSSSQQDNVIDLETLQTKIRLGFSEWQLYAYFNTYIDQSNKRWLGLMGNANGPHVAEFNENSLYQEDLKKLLDSPNPPPFLYFYPAINKSKSLLCDYFSIEG